MLNKRIYICIQQMKNLEVQSNLANYSYLEQIFKTQKSDPSQISHITHQTVQDIYGLISHSASKILLSHSSIHSQFNELCTQMQKLHEQVQCFDLTHIESFRKIKNMSNESSLILISVFGQRYQKYLPVLKWALSQFENAQNTKIIIYCDCAQQETILKLSETNKTDLLLVQLSAVRPFEISSGNILQQLKKFLVEQSKQPTKFDVVLFHPKTDILMRSIHHMIKTQGIASSTQLITQPGAYLNEDLSNVIIVNKTKTLFEWNYNLSSVYLVLDSGRQSTLYFNYDYECYVEDEVKIDWEQCCRRMNLISSRVGQYIMQKDGEDQNECKERINNEYTDTYCLGLAYFGLGVDSEVVNKNVKCCIQALKENKIISNEGINLKLSNQDIFFYALKGINPIFANIFAHQNVDKKYYKYLTLIYSIILSPNLRPTSQQYRPSGVWRQSGYLHSALDIIIKVQMLQRNHVQQPIDSDEEDYYSLKALANKYIFISSVYEQILNKNRTVQQILGLKPEEIQENMEVQQFNEVLQIMLLNFKRAVAFNSGSRRLGYFSKGKQSGILPHHQCLMRLLNERPSFILLTRIAMEDGQMVIDHCNYIQDQIIITAYGAIPVTSKQSFGQCQIEFYEITGSIFSHLSKYNSVQVENFQKQHECSVQLNEQIGTITVQCSKLKEKQIRQRFQNLINEIKETYKKQARIVKHSKTLQIVISSGGQIKQIQVNQDGGAGIQDTCVVRNLDPEVELADLKDLFDQFVQLKEIKMDNQKTQNRAIITFYSFEDYKTFFGYFQSCVYLGRSMIIEPYIPKVVQVLPQKYLLFQWNQWKSQKQAKIVMENISGAKKAAKILTQLGYSAQCKQQNVLVSGLSSTNDERDLEIMLVECGKIIQIHISRFCSQNKQEDHLIQKMINQSFRGDEIKFTSEAVFKGKNGYRSKKVKFESDNIMKEAYFLMNQITGRIGAGKLYATPIFTYPVNLPNDESYIPVYEDIIKEVAEEMSRAKPIATELLNERDNKYIILMANEDAEVDLIVNFLSQKLQGKEIKINVEDESILFSEIALQKIRSLQKKYICKFTFEPLTKKIKVLSRSKNIHFIQKQINTKLIEQFMYPIPVYANAFRYINNNFQSIKLKNPTIANIKIQFQTIAKNIILTGKIDSIIKAKDELERIVKNMRKKSEGNVEADDYCPLCCEEFTHPFKLEGCGHKFCFDCLQSTIRVTLKDLSMYPIKCPECLDKILVSDLNCLCTEKDWKQIVHMSINHFVYTNPSQYTFCYTASCPQINIIEGNWFRCRECKKGYCLSCKGNYHPGMSCEENRYGSDRLFKDYMGQIGGRICANKSCRAPIVRIDGCFKVQCSRCKKSMCFKCSQQEMVAYDTCQQAYEHLDKKHGGCF